MFDDDRVLELAPEPCDPRLQESLLVLCGVVLEVLREITEGPRGGNRLDSSSALRPFHVGKLRLERRALRRGELLAFEIAHAWNVVELTRTLLVWPRISPPCPAVTWSRSGFGIWRPMP